MTAVAAVLAAVVWTALAYATRRREQLFGTDEGYLLYGTQRLLRGEQPVRDLRSYEPGRYWLAAAVTRLRGPGLVSVRLAAHLTAGLGLACLGAALAGAGAPVAAVVVLPLVVLAWRPGHHKLFDSGALCLVAAGGVLTLQGTPGGALLLGVAVGLAGVLGLNLGLYGAVSAVLVVGGAMLAGTAGPTALVAIAAGGLLGGAPLLVWWTTVPGTWAATRAARVTVPRARGSTNLPLPLPWPWRPDRRVGGAPTRATRALVRGGLVVLPLLAVAAATAALRTGAGVAGTVALAAVGLATFHHALSRADLSHLGLSAPFLLLAPVGLAPPWGSVAAVVAAAVCVPLVRDLHPRLRRRRHPAAMERRDLGGDIVWLSRRAARQLDALRSVLDDDEGVAAVPYGLALVAALDRRSAIRDTFPVYPASPEEDAAMVAELEAARPVVVLVDDTPLDGREELRFSATHPRTWQWLIGAGTDLTGDAGLPAGVTLWRVGSR